MKFLSASLTASANIAATSVTLQPFKRNEFAPILVIIPWMNPRWAIVLSILPYLPFNLRVEGFYPIVVKYITAVTFVQPKPVFFLCISLLDNIWIKAKILFPHVGIVCWVFPDGYNRNFLFFPIEVAAFPRHPSRRVWICSGYIEKRFWWIHPLPQLVSGRWRHFTTIKLGMPCNSLTCLKLMA